ncbi:serum response factor homolog A-like isoform X2 [Anopheles darlingi]|uniref:serum response factor homolog A-like isoform X2 n=1 Tax=Anopheles darlingi TaxID=43151 RepID=UPI0021003A4E|nr:serum response factor homolog A-like isoform X2 [Anopheles darlingi]
MAKVLLVLLALLAFSVAAPTRGRLQNRRTSVSWNKADNTIEEVSGVEGDNGQQQQQQQQQEQQEQQQEQQEQQEQLEQETQETRKQERMVDYIDRQRGQRSGAGWLEDREARNREAIDRAQGRLPERELRRWNDRKVKKGGKHFRGTVKAKDQTLEEQKANGVDEYYNDFPLYDFAYGVYDPATGDKKEQWEKRVGDFVKGKYTLEQPDGTKRIVEYEADDKNGFEAIVKEIDRIDGRNGVKWGHTDEDVAQSYSKLNKYD